MGATSPISPGWEPGQERLFGFSVLVHVFGLGYLSGSQKGQPCVIGHEVRFDPAYEFRRTAFPLANPCNAEYDLVPAWVNVAVVLFAAATLACLGVPVVLTRRDRRAATTRP